MRVIVFILACVLSATTVVAESANDVIKKAGDFLVKKGVAADSIQLEEIGAENGCHVLVNRTQRGGFVIMAADEFSNVLDNQVLAYSISKKSWLNYQKNKTLKKMLEYYGSCLRQLKEEGRHDTALEAMTQQYQRVKPLLMTNWGQLKLESSFGGKQIRLVSGCVATAESMLLRYWNYPSQMRGTVNFSMDSLSNNLFECRMDTIRFDWQRIPGNSVKTSEQKEQLKRLQALCGMTLFPKYGGEATSASFDQLKYSLVNHFGFSARMTMLQSNHIEPAAILQKAYQELLAKRPVAISTKGHALLMDGYYEGFFHLNFGWGGRSNGYYRLFTVRPYLSIIIGIMPEESVSTPVEREIEVKKAGTLASLLPEAMNVRKLTVKGKLNGDDWRLIRRMAGAADRSDLSLPIGVLQELDLSEARFVESRVPYMSLTGKQANIKSSVMRSHKTKWAGQVQKSVEKIPFNTSKMNHDMYKELEDVNMIKIFGYDIEEKKKDSLYMIHFMLDNERLNNSVFMGCDNLKKVVLGNSIVETRGISFAGCSALETVEFRAKVLKFNVKTFRNLKRLRAVYTYCGEDLNGSLFRDSFYPYVTIKKPGDWRDWESDGTIND